MDYVEHVEPVGFSDHPFGDTLRHLRRGAGWTQAELAERAGLSIRGLSDLERGINRYPRRETLLALADSFGLADQERVDFLAVAHRRPPADRPRSATAGHRPDDRAVQMGAIQVFLIADVRGYTTYTYEHRDEDAAQLAMRFAALAGAAVSTHGGNVLEVRGDEVLAVFTSARGALQAAILLQEMAEQASRETREQPIRCGIGLEAGEATPVPGGYRGLAINLAARLCSRAGPGEVLAGEAVIRLARKVSGLSFRDLGSTSLKGFAAPVRVTQVLAAEAPLLGAAVKSRTEPAQATSTESHRTAVGNFLSAQPRHRLVAREAEVATLLSVLEAVEAGSGRTVILVGEPGVGKTRLAQEVLQAAQERGFLVATGRCYAPQETVPYYPFLEALTRADAAAPAAMRLALPTQWPEVARLIPDQSAALPTISAPHPAGSGGADDQQRLFWQVTRYLQALAAEHPLALLVDDLHWMDGASLELLLHLARNTRDSRILLLGTYRDSEVPRQHPLARGLQDLHREELIERIDLAQLSREGTSALLGATLEEGEVSEAVTEVVYAPTEGNAFFVQEVLRGLVERGDIALQNGCWELRPGADVVVPENVRAAVLERVGRLSASAQQTLALASVLGQTFLFDDLLAMRLLAATPATGAGPLPGEAAGNEASISETILEAALEEAEAARVVREMGGTGYAFNHSLAQRALYEQVSARRRRRLHRAAAGSILRLPQTERRRRVADVAYHFLEADERAQALPYVLAAGEQAETVYAYSEAERQFRAAKSLAHQLGDEQAESVAGERLGQTLFNLARHDEAGVVLEQAALYAERSGDLARLAFLTSLQTYTDAHLGSAAKGVARLLRLIETARVHGPSPELARLYLSLTYRYRWSGQYAEQLDAVEQALQVALAVGEPGLEAEARMRRGVALSHLSRLEEALREFEAALPVLEDWRDLDSQRLTQNNLGWVLIRLGRIDEAEAHVERALALAEQLAFPDAIAWQSTSCALCSYVRGDWAPAWSYLERATALRPSLDTSPWINALLYEAEGWLLLAKGQPEAATQSAEAGLALARRYGNLQRLRDSQQLLAEIELQQGDPAAARGRLLPLLDRGGLTETDVNALLPLLTWAHLLLGEVDAAETLAARTVARLRAQHDYFTLVDALRVEATLRIRQRRWVEAEALLSECLAQARRMPYPYAEARALSTYGDLLEARGEPEAAHEQYEAALAILRSLGEVPYAARIEGALTRARNASS